MDQELIEGTPWEEHQVIALLKNILEVLAFVHKEKIIHRDIHPQNLIRCTSNNKIVLIDFWAVKEINNSQCNSTSETRSPATEFDRGATPIKPTNDVFL